MPLQPTDLEILVGSVGVDRAGAAPDITTLVDGRMLVTWTEHLSQPTDAFDDLDGAIFARLFEADGRAAGEAFQVNTWQPFEQDRPHVAALADGGFAIGWTSNGLYGDFPADPDSFVQIFDDDGSLRAGFDVLPDNPDRAQTLVDLVSLTSSRIAAVQEDGIIQVYGPNGAFLETLTPSGFGSVAGRSDIAQLESGNVVRASAVDDGVRVTLTNAFFDGPDGIPGIYLPLDFLTKGTEDKLTHSVGLEAIVGGGFVLAYNEDVDRGRSALRVEIYTEFGKRVDSRVFERDVPYDAPEADFDLLALSGGGFALAMVRPDGRGTTTGIDLLLLDADGRVDTRLRATATDTGNQSEPSLTELPDGRIAVAFSDDSDRKIGGSTDRLHVSFFEVEGLSGRFVGTDGDDVLGGVGGNDEIFGLAGDDVIRGRRNDDILRGGEGDDRLLGGSGRDALRGGDGNDTLEGEDDNDGLSGGLGDDFLNGGSGRDVLGGGAGRDRLFGGIGNDILKGGAGNDGLRGQNGNDILKGDDGNDRLDGGEGDDRIVGGAGDDQLTGGAGADVFVFDIASPGDDVITDFDASVDTIQLELRGNKRATVEVETKGGDTVITYGRAEETIRLEGVRLREGDIDFDFV